jgi:hypothetical protein
MKQIATCRSQLWTLAILLFALLVTGCSAQVSAESAEGSDTAVYTGALDTAHEDALDPSSQLALGTLNLEGTADAVTETQAAALLPLWQVLQGDELRSDAERYATVRQIEATMTQAQVSAIAGMRLTQSDAQAWAQHQGTVQLLTGGPSPGNRRMLESPSEEQIAQMREQSSKQAGASTTGGTPMSGTSWQGLIRAVVDLLGQRSGKAVVAQLTPLPTVDAQPTAGPTQTPDPTATAAPTPTVEPAAEAEPTSTSAPTALPTSTPAATPTPASSDETRPESGILPAVTPAPALEQVEDTSPGPPFTIEISTNVAVQDPLVEASRTYKVTGIVRNDGDQTYDVSNILVTFYDAEGFRGTFQPAIRDGKLVGGEWHWHGETEAEFGALLLAPGEEWPFIVEITAQDMAAFLVHPDALATDREATPVELSDVGLVDAGTGYLRISGTATNVSSLKAKNVTVSGVLLDASGQIVSVGSVYVLQEDVEPGASVRFDLRIEREPYATYQLYAHAERDWN